MSRSFTSQDCASGSDIGFSIGNTLKSFASVTAILAAAMFAVTPAVAEEDEPRAAMVTASVSDEAPETELRKSLRESTAIKGLNDKEIEALTAYYADPQAKHLWTDDKSANDAARAVLVEIAKAYDYGLDPAAFDAPELPGDDADIKALGRFELEVSRALLIYARHAKGGRVTPKQVGTQLPDPPVLPEPASILEGIASATDAAEYLRSLHPQNPEFEKLRKMLLALRGARDERAALKLPEGPSLRKGQSHEQVVLLRKRLGIEGDAEKPQLFDEGVDAAVRKFQRENGLGADGVVGPGTRRVLNGGSPETKILKILVNMERWRWLPDDLDEEANIYVWANIPEFKVRIVKQDKVVFKERVIVGKVDKKTPVFSDRMEWIEFHPVWYVPNSIKVEDILPSLQRTTSRVVERYNLKLNCGAHGSDHKAIDWNSVDIRKCAVSQPPGEKSVLGDFKFKFPNKHAVYMHDTPTKRLFNTSTRTYSHGCVRIRNPRRMAELLLEHDKAMPSSRVGQILAGPKNPYKESLNTPVPVHITYFTMLHDEDGKLVNSGDYYGHDRRLAQALTGKGHLLPVAAAPGRPPRRKKKKTREAQAAENWGNFSQN